MAKIKVSGTKSLKINEKQFQKISVKKSVKKISVKFQKTTNIKKFPLPVYKTPGSAGMDLHAANTKNVSIKPGKVGLISTGFKFEIPLGFEGQIRPRSGLALRNSVSVLNSPGTIDSDYRGEVKVILINFGEEDFVVKPLDRIAQIVFSRVFQADFEEGDLEESERGVKGFGSTGVSDDK